MVLAVELSDGLAMYVGRPAISPSAPTGEPVARVPERQHGFIVGCSDMFSFFEWQYVQSSGQRILPGLRVNYKQSERVGITSMCSIRVCLHCGRCKVFTFHA